MPGTIRYISMLNDSPMCILSDKDIQTNIIVTNVFDCFILNNAMIRWNYFSKGSSQDLFML